MTKIQSLEAALLAEVGKPVRHKSHKIGAQVGDFGARSVASRVSTKSIDEVFPSGKLGWHANQLAKGIEVEKEHLRTLDNLYEAAVVNYVNLVGLKDDDRSRKAQAAKKVAIDFAIKSIAQDHLREIPDYYDRLERLEHLRTGGYTQQEVGRMNTPQTKEQIDVFVKWLRSDLSQSPGASVKVGDNDAFITDSSVVFRDAGETSTKQTGLYYEKSNVPIWTFDPLKEQISSIERFPGGEYSIKVAGKPVLIVVPLKNVQTVTQAEVDVPVAEGSDEEIELFGGKLRK